MCCLSKEERKRTIFFREPLDMPSIANKMRLNHSDGIGTLQGDL